MKMTEVMFSDSPIVNLKVFNYDQPFATSIFKQLSEIILKKGETVFSTANTSHSIFLVTKGMVKVVSFHDGREMLEDYFQAGEMLNCELLLGNSPEMKNAEALTNNTVVKKIPVKTFMQAMENDAVLCREVVKNIWASLNRTQERLRRMTLLNSQQRVIDFLVSHVLKSGRKVGFEYVVKPALTHQEIGYIAGTGRQTVTTVLNELRKDGIIHFNRSYLIVRDLNKLMQLVD